MAESTLQGFNFVVGFNNDFVNAVQDRTLERVFHDALYPRMLFRGEASPEQWVTNLGNNTTFTRSGLIRPTTRPLNQTNDPTPKNYGVEQWEATALQYGDSIDTHMPTSYVSLASIWLRNIHTLGLHSSQSLNRIVRDKLYNAYASGQSVVRNNPGAGLTLEVVSLNGFTRRLQNGRPALISPTNPLEVVITTGAVPTTYNVVGFTPDFANDEIHGGVLTLDAAHAGLVARDTVIASNSAEIVRVGGGASVDAVAATDQLDMATLRQSVAQLRRNLVPTHEDGSYHCHLGPDSESQVFGDNEFQRLNQSIPDYVHYREFALAHILGITFYRNTETPLAATVDQDPQFGFTFAPELANALGVPVSIHRPIITGGGCVEEKYLDESRYISEAGVNGKIGEFSLVNGGMQVMTERIRLIMRAPQDRLQQLVSSAWSLSGDWPVPTDSTSPTSSADFKRAVIIEHGA